MKQPIKMCELSIYDRGLLVDDINKIMVETYNVDQESVNEFWETFVAGAEKTEMA